MAENQSPVSGRPELQKGVFGRAFEINAKPLQPPTCTVIQETQLGPDLGFPQVSYWNYVHMEYCGAEKRQGNRRTETLGTGSLEKDVGGSMVEHLSGNTWI